MYPSAIDPSGFSLFRTKPFNFFMYLSKKNIHDNKPPQLIQPHLLGGLEDEPTSP